MRWILMLSLLASCGPNSEAEENTSRSNASANNAALMCDESAGGGACSSSADCATVDCRCNDGSVVTSRSCSDGMCEGADQCDSVCASAGSSNACEHDTSNDSNNSSNSSSNERGNNTPNNSPVMCESDLSEFANWDWGYNVECLEQNCCEQASYCATFASCRAYDDCLLPCFTGGVDNDCIVVCKEANTTPEFLMDAYAPFSTCALNNDCQ